MRGYEVLRKLADGSAAEVFLARTTSSNDRVVLEVIRPELTSDMDFYGRFLDEAKERQTLTHPHLLRRTTAGCAPDGRIFVVTEPVRGDHLGSFLLAHGPLAPADAARLLLPICEVLGYLHSRGYVHGNLRPSNVFVGGKPPKLEPKLLDTGLALFRAKRSVTAPKAMTLVPPEYLAPERVSGQRATSLSDVYGMGVLLFELLTGKPPFSSPDAHLTRSLHLEAAPPPLPNDCRELQGVVSGCLRKEPPHRFRDMGELGAALGQALANVPSRKPLARPRQPASSPQSAKVQGGPTPVVGEPVGQVLGSYELIDLIGQGGMGRVYLARHTRLDRRVAIKLLRPELAADPGHLHRFFQEARAVNRVRNKHIVEIHDFVEEPKERGGHVYCVMEHLEGQTLRDLTKKGPVPLARVLSIMRQVCDALDAAHEVGVIHRDVKPDNIFLVSSNEAPDFVKVLDFGVAKLRAHASEGPADMTRAGALVGTPAFMAPEQALGDAVDHRADIYSLATVLYALLTGKPPFVGSSLAQVITRLVSHPPLPLPEKNLAQELIPSGLRAVVMKCLSKRPEERFQTMRHLSSALASCDPEAASPAPTPPPSALENPEEELVLQQRFEQPSYQPTPPPLERPRPRRSLAVVPSRPTAAPRPPSATRIVFMGLLAVALGAGAAWGLLRLTSGREATAPTLAPAERAPLVGPSATTEPAPATARPQAPKQPKRRR